MGVAGPGCRTVAGVAPGKRSDVRRWANGRETARIDQDLIRLGMCKRHRPFRGAVIVFESKGTDWK